MPMTKTTDIKEAPVATLEEILAAKCGDVVDTGAGTPLIVHRRQWADGVLSEELDTIQPIYAVLTLDGRHYIPAWHQGDEAEWIYVERWGAEGREFHGWADSVSRKLLQAG